LIWLISAFQHFSISAFQHFSVLDFLDCKFKGEFARIDGNDVFGDIAAMRLGANEAKAVGEEVRRLDPAAEIYLYGSRANDAAKGGDIDLLVVSDKLGFRDVLRLRTRILDRIGWQQLDLVVRRRDQMDEPLAAMAQETGIKL
jgi:predicted nucleotidyltransferase